MLWGLAAAGLGAGGGAGGDPACCTPPPRASRVWASGRLFELLRSLSDFLAARGPGQLCGRSQGSRREGLGPLRDFFWRAMEGQVGRGSQTGREGQSTLGVSGCPWARG